MSRAEFVKSIRSVRNPERESVSANCCESRLTSRSGLGDVNPMTRCACLVVESTICSMGCSQAFDIRSPEALRCRSDCSEHLFHVNPSETTKTSRPQESKPASETRGLVFPSASGAFWNIGIGSSWGCFHSPAELIYQFPVLWLSVKSEGLRFASDLAIKLYRLNFRAGSQFQAHWRGAFEAGAARELFRRVIPYLAFHRSLPASEATSTSGENKYSRMRRLPVLISTVTAMPGTSGTSAPSTFIVFFVSARVTGNTRF